MLFAHYRRKGRSQFIGVKCKEMNHQSHSFTLYMLLEGMFKIKVNVLVWDCKVGLCMKSCFKVFHSQVDL
jgi:hypothetical protein